MAVAGPYLAAASAAVGVATGIASANQARASAAFQRQQYEDRQKALKLQAAQEEAARLEALDRTLQTQRVMMAAAGIDNDQSPTFFTIQDESKDRAARDIANVKLGIYNNIYQAQIGSSQAQFEGEAGAMGGYLKAGGSALKAGYEVYKASGSTGESAGTAKYKLGEGVKTSSYDPFA
jgi:hypothetical protein